MRLPVMRRGSFRTSIPSITPNLQDKPTINPPPFPLPPSELSCSYRAGYVSMATRAPPPCHIKPRHPLAVSPLRVSSGYELSKKNPPLMNVAQSNSRCRATGVTVVTSSAGLMSESARLSEAGRDRGAGIGTEHMHKQSIGSQRITRLD